MIEPLQKCISFRIPAFYLNGDYLTGIGLSVVAIVLIFLFDGF